MAAVATDARHERVQARVRGRDGVWTRGQLDARAQLELFCRLVFGEVPAGRWLHVWAAKRRADGRLVAFRRDPLAFVGEADALVDQALVWHGRGLEVFAGVLPRSRPRPDNGAVADGALVWADVDEADALGRLEVFCRKFRPHYLAASGGGGRHAAWLLTQLHPGGELVEACRRLAEEVGGDLAVCHPGASLRLPGTRNRKSGAGWCELLAADLALAPYELAALVGELPPPSPGGVGRSGTALGEGGGWGRGGATIRTRGSRRRSTWRRCAGWSAGRGRGDLVSAARSQGRAPVVRRVSRPGARVALLLAPGCAGRRAGL